MKRIASIAFIFVILLNTMGYYGVFLGLHYQNDLAMTRSLDADNYDTGTELTLSIAVTLPYMPDQTDFERINGEFEHNGEFYRLVKRKYAQDTLTIICVKDSEHKKISQALSDYVKTFTDKATGNSSGSKVTVTFLKDYLPNSFAINSSTKGWTTRVIHNSRYHSLIPTFVTSILHPPERA